MSKLIICKFQKDMLWYDGAVLDTAVGQFSCLENYVTEPICIEKLHNSMFQTIKIHVYLFETADYFQISSGFHSRLFGCMC